MVIVGTIPVGLLGLFLADIHSKRVLFDPLAGIDICLSLCQRHHPAVWREYARPRHLQRISSRRRRFRWASTTFRFVQAFFIGLAQALALIPGISRSGVTMVACLQSRLNHEDALHFTFLLATPVILAAGLLEVPKLFHVSHTTQLAALLGGLVAAVAALPQREVPDPVLPSRKPNTFCLLLYWRGTGLLLLLLAAGAGLVYTTLGRTLAAHELGNRLLGLCRPYQCVLSVLVGSRCWCCRDLVDK